MRLIAKHLTYGLIYPYVMRLLPAFPGTIFSLFWQLVNLYGSLPAVILTAFIFQLAAVAIAAILVTGSLFVLDFRVAFGIALAILALLVITWAVVSFSLNRRADFSLFRLHYSSSTALILLSILLGHRIPEIKVSPGTTIWEIHLKPSAAGNLDHRDRTTIAQAIGSDYRRAAELLGPDTIAFGCSPGSFARLLLQAGINESYFTTFATIIPTRHSRVFGNERPFYFYIIQINEEALPDND